MTIRMQMSLWNINSETGNVKYTISEIINFIIRGEFLWRVLMNILHGKKSDWKKEGIEICCQV